MKARIEEVKPEEEKYVTFEKGHFWLDKFYDRERQIFFYVLKEPHWMKFEFWKDYDITIIDDSDDAETFQYRLAVRLSTDTVILAEHYDKWYTIEENYVADNVKKIELFEYIATANSTVAISDPTLGHTKNEDS